MTDPISPTHRPQPVGPVATRPQTDLPANAAPGTDDARHEPARRHGTPAATQHRDDGTHNRQAGEQGAREHSAGSRHPHPAPATDTARTAKTAHRAPASAAIHDSVTTTRPDLAPTARPATAAPTIEPTVTPARTGVGAVMTGLASSVDLPATVVANDGNTHIILKTADAYLRLPIPADSQENPPKPGESLVVTLRADGGAKAADGMVATLTRPQTPPSLTTPLGTAPGTAQAPYDAAAPFQSPTPGVVRAVPVPPPGAMPAGALPSVTGTAHASASSAPGADAVGTPPIRPGIAITAILTVREQGAAASLPPPLARLTEPEALGSRVRLSVLTVTPPPPDTLAGESTTTPAAGAARPATQTTAATPPTGNPAGLSPTTSGLAERTAQMIRIGIDIDTRPGAHPAVDSQHATVITGTVSGRDGDGNTLIRTAIGSLSLLLSRPLVPGTELMLAVRDVLPPLNAEVAALASARGADGAGEGGGVNALALIRQFETGWPALDDAIRAMTAYSPAAAERLVAQFVPSPGPRMTAVLFAFMSALNSGSLRSGSVARSSKRWRLPGVVTFCNGWATISPSFPACRSRLGTANGAPLLLPCCFRAKSDP